MQAPHADLERVIALVPVRVLEHAKTRLGAVLDAEERAALAAGLVARTLDALVAACDAGALQGIVVASADPAALARARLVGASPIPVGGRDLVADLRVAREVAIVDGATAILVVPIDLAHVSAAAVGDVVAAGRAARDPDAPLVVLVPDNAGTGTNALLLSPPRAIDFAFGPGSRARHAEAARAAGAVLVELAGPLALDLDTPDDLAAAGDAVVDLAASPGPPPTVGSATAGAGAAAGRR